MKIFAERLNKLRCEKEITQIHLEKILGYSGCKVHHMERNRRDPNIYDVIALAKFFNVSTDYLLGLTDVMN